ncbi:hypothetical protein [Jeotgalicoccus psychrophilus]|nr:hypothetical protein [Jeotgalicoccus psychrophilus]
MTVKTWRERHTHEKYGNYIIYYDQHKADGATITEIYIDRISKGKTINNR